MFGTDLIGKPLSEVDTPALVIDADAMEQNIAEMGRHFSDLPVSLRPHAKTHKSPIIAHKQIAAGAIGVTCAKLGEAEAMVEGGVLDVLVANQIVGRQKIDRLVRLARHGDIKVAVDSEENLRQISAAAVGAGSVVGVLVEVNTGMNRCGVQPGDDAVRLAKIATSLPGIDFFGIHAYEGHLQNVRDHAEREARARAAMAPVIETRRMIESAGVPVRAVSGGGTGTFDITSTIEGFDEIQAGSYVFMDSAYGKVEGPRQRFLPALFLWTTIVSRPTPDRAVGDIGLKTAAPEHGLPHLLDIDGCETLSLSEEHIRLTVSGDAAQLRVGDKVRFQPGHVCTTVNLHDWYVVARGDTVEAIWPVAARGRSR
jgi:D-serine deaminase-like pyridoxal phosphate-dependent protein